jgi:hypothetical protein
MNPFFVTPIAEKVSALKTQAYMLERQQRADPQALEDWLTLSPAAKPVAGDEVLAVVSE